MLQPQRASCGGVAQEHLRGRTQADERNLRRRPRTDTPRRSPIRIRQIAERDLAWSLDVMADDFGTGVRDDHLVLLGHHVNPLADQRLRHQVASRAEPNAAAFFNLALFARA